LSRSNILSSIYEHYILQRFSLQLAIMLQIATIIIKSQINAQNRSKIPQLKL